MGNLKNQNPVPFKVSTEQQIIKAEWLEDISLRELGTIDVHHST